MRMVHSIADGLHSLELSRMARMNVNGIRNPSYLALEQEYQAKFEAWLANRPAGYFDKGNSMLEQFTNTRGSEFVSDLLRKAVTR
jgi:hypothetical protein